MPKGDYLDAVVQREIIGGRDGRTGTSLERVVLADGRRFVVKRVRAQATGSSRDSVGLECMLWRRGVLDVLPAPIEHAVVDSWVDDDATVVVMRDLGARVGNHAGRLTAGQCDHVLASLASMYASFADEAPSGLRDLADVVTRSAPQRLEAECAGSDRAAAAARGWEAFADVVDRSLCEQVLALLDRPEPLVDALRAEPCTLIHGDLDLAAIVIDDESVTLVDWSMAAEAPAAVDVALLLARGLSTPDFSPDEFVATFTRVAGPVTTPSATSLGLLCGLLVTGGDQALMAATHPDPAVRAARRDDLGWWVASARQCLDTALR